MDALFDQTFYGATHEYEAFPSATLSMDDAAFSTAYLDEGYLDSFFPISPPTQHSHLVSPPSEYEDNYVLDYSGPSLRATTEGDFAGADYGAQQASTAVAPEMGYYGQVPTAPCVSSGWDTTANITHSPFAIGSPVDSGALYDAVSGYDTAAQFFSESMTAPMTSLPGAADDYIPVRTAQKRRAGGDEDEGRVVKRPRHTVGRTPKGKKTPPDPRTGLALPGETMFHTSNKYKTVVLEEHPQERQTLASVPPAEAGPSTQRGPDRPTKRARKAAPVPKPEVASADGRKGRRRKAATPEERVVCAWPACLETGEMCTKAYGRAHDMFRHLQSKHLRFPHECPNCGAYVLRELRAHQRRPTCVRVAKEEEEVRERKAQSALVQKEVTGVVGGERLLDREVRSLLEAIRALIEAGRSQPDDIEDGIDLWMKQNKRVWQKVMSIARAHAPPS